MAKLKLHPVKGNVALAGVLVPLIDGGITDFLNAHGSKYDKQLKGLLKGSLRKRILNQMLAEESRLRDALNGDGPIPPHRGAK